MSALTVAGISSAARSRSTIVYMRMCTAHISALTTALRTNPVTLSYKGCQNVCPILIILNIYNIYACISNIFH